MTTLAFEPPTVTLLDGGQHALYPISVTQFRNYLKITADPDPAEAFMAGAYLLAASLRTGLTPDDAGLLLSIGNLNSVVDKILHEVSEMPRPTGEA